MLTELDSELFPDDCEVVEIPPHNPVYLIFKNGSTRLKAQSKIDHGKIYRNHEIGDLPVINVLIRDPVKRYISGVSKFVEATIDEHKHLDEQTCLHMALRYNFLNRHYLPQFFWLVNLSRYINPTCKLNLIDFKNISDFTRCRLVSLKPKTDLNLKYPIKMDEQRILGLFLDRILLDNVGKCLTWNEILDLYKTHPARPLDLVRLKADQILNALS